MIARLREYCGRFRPLLVAFERPVLVFPVAVVLILSASFILGGRCCALQWWGGVAVAVACCFYRCGNWKKGVAVAALFLAWLVVFWLLVRTTVTYGFGHVDQLRYHTPAIHMMIDGWNPVWEGTVEAMRKVSGISPSSFRANMLIAMPKGVWYFNAAAFFFTRAPFSLMTPVFLALFIGLIFSIVSEFRRFPISLRVAAVLLALGVAMSPKYMVDSAVAISGLGLLLAMYSYLRSGEWNWLRLLSFTFWMMVSKQTALLHCCIFWGVFFAACLIKRNWNCWRRFLIAGGIAFAAFVVASISPYVSSTVNFGHPLYPHHSSDPQKYPTEVVAEDFVTLRNGDAAEMGHVGAYVNAFVSSSAALSYYRLKLHRPDFMPVSDVWKDNLDPSPGAPTSTLFRLVFCVMLFVLFYMGGVGGRFVATSMVFATVLMPTAMLGYLRYVPWIWGVGIFGILVLIGSAAPVVMRLARCVLCLIAFAVVLPNATCLFAESAADAYNIRRTLKRNPPKVILSSRWGGGHFNAKKDVGVSGRLLLLQRQVPEFRDAEVVANPLVSSYKGDIAAGGGKEFFDRSFMVLPQYKLEYEKSTNYRRILSVPINQERTRDYLAFVLNTLLVTFPKSCWEAIIG